MRKFSLLVFVALWLALTASDALADPFGTSMGDSIEPFQMNSRVIFPKKEAMSHEGYESVITCLAVDPGQVPGANRDYEKMFLYFCKGRLVAVLGVLKDMTYDQETMKFDLYREEFTAKYGKPKEKSQTKLVWEAEGTACFDANVKKAFIYKRNYADAFVEFKNKFAVGFVYVNHVDYNAEMRKQLRYAKQRKRLLDELTDQDIRERERIKVQRILR